MDSIMTSFDSILTVWRQVKRVLSTAVFVGGVYVLWLLYIGDIQGPVMLLFGAILTGLGGAGMLFPSKVRVFEDRSGPD